MTTLEQTGKPGSAAVKKVASHRRKNPWRPFIVPLVALFAGLLLLSYPVVASQWNNYRAMHKANSYVSAIESSNPETLATLAERAHEYNARLGSGPAYDPWSHMPDTNTPEYKDYESQLVLNDTMGTIRIPSIKVDLPIYHGTSDSVLDDGVGHLYGSSLPVGGPGTHAVVTAHTGLSDQTLFDNVKDMRKGDAIFVSTAAGTLKYEVDQIRVVLPDNTDDLQRVDGEDLLTLVTCTPYGVNSHRLLVRGHRVPYSPETDEKMLEESSGLIWQWWMIAVLAAVVIILLILLAICFAAYVSAKRRKAKMLLAQ